MEQLKVMFLADGQGLPGQETDDLCKPVGELLTVLQLETGILIRNFKDVSQSVSCGTCMSVIALQAFRPMPKCDISKPCYLLFILQLKMVMWATIAAKWIVFIRKLHTRVPKAFFLRPLCLVVQPCSSQIPCQAIKRLHPEVQLRPCGTQGCELCDMTCLCPPACPSCKSDMCFAHAMSKELMRFAG